MASVNKVLSIQEFLLAYGMVDDAEVERHNDRTMTVVTPQGVATITRCGVCPKEDARPCLALRVLALPYAQHPEYQPEWVIEPRVAREVPVPPLPYQRLPELPGPGNARRRMLRQYGINISRADYTDEELAQRGIVIGTHAPQEQ